MRPLALLLAALFLAPALCAGEINFTPHPDQSLLDGALVHRVWFGSSDAHISIRTVPDWEVTGTPAGLRIASRKWREAVAQIENAEGKLPPAFDEEGLVKYREFSRKLLPPLAEEVQPLKETLDPFPINEWQSFEIAYSYRLTGRQFVRRFVFLKLDPHREIRMTLDALDTDAESFSNQIRTTLNSWLEGK